MNLSGVMMEIGGLSAAGFVRPVTDTLRAVTPGSASQSPAGPALPARRPDPEAPTGPPPAFATTPLEVETNLDLRLARLNAAGYATVQAMGGAAAQPGPTPDAAGSPSADRPAAMAPSEAGEIRGTPGAAQGRR